MSLSSSSKKHILFFNTCKSWGGGEKWHFDMATAISKKCKVTLITNLESELAKKAKAHNLNVIEVQLSKYDYLNPFKVKAIRSLLKKVSPDSMIMNLSSDMKIAGLASKGVIKDVIYRRGSAIAVKNSFINRYLFKNCIHRVLCNSKATAQKLLEKNDHLFPKDKISIIYNGIDLSKYKSNLKENSCFEIINVGRLYRQKNQIFLLKLASILKEQNISFRISIVGSGVEEDHLKEEISKRQLQDHVFLLGFQKDVASFLTQKDLFILPSLWEGFGYVLAESLASSVPCLGFNISSTPELITHNENGYLVPTNDLDRTVELIKNLIQSPQELLRLKKNAYQSAEKFSIENTISKLSKMLKL